MHSPNTIRLIAWFELAKGAAVLLAASGLLALMHRDVHALAALWVEHLHLNPASRYPKIFVDAATQLNDARLWQLAAGAALYAAVRLAEGYGLYRQRAWAEVLAAVSGAIYVPFELVKLAKHPSALSAALLVLNLAVVAVMVWALVSRRKSAANKAFGR